MHQKEPIKNEKNKKNKKNINNNNENTNNTNNNTDNTTNNNKNNNNNNNNHNNNNSCPYLIPGFTVSSRLWREVAGRWVEVKRWMCRLIKTSL